MKRRSFFGALAGLLLAPFAVKAKEKPVTIRGVPVLFIPPIKRLYIDYFCTVQRKADCEIACARDWPSPAIGKIRFRVDDGDWETMGGPLPVKFVDGACLDWHGDKAVIILEDKRYDVCFGDPDRPFVESVNLDDWEMDWISWNGLPKPK